MIQINDTTPTAVVRNNNGKVNNNDKVLFITQSSIAVYNVPSGLQFPDKWKYSAIDAKK